MKPVAVLQPNLVGPDAIRALPAQLLRPTPAPPTTQHVVAAAPTPPVVADNAPDLLDFYMPMTPVCSEDSFEAAIALPQPASEHSIPTEPVSHSSALHALLDSSSPPLAARHQAVAQAQAVPAAPPHLVFSGFHNSFVSGPHATVPTCHLTRSGYDPAGCASASRRCEAPRFLRLHEHLRQCPFAVPPCSR